MFVWSFCFYFVLFFVRDQNPVRSVMCVVCVSCYLFFLFCCAAGLCDLCWNLSSVIEHDADLSSILYCPTVDFSNWNIRKRLIWTAKHFYFCPKPLSTCSRQMTSSIICRAHPPKGFQEERHSERRKEYCRCFMRWQSVSRGETMQRWSWILYAPFLSFVMFLSMNAESTVSKPV